MKNIKKNVKKNKKNIKAKAVKGSQVGKKGTPGAPEKPVRYPRGNFTVESAVNLNAGKVCGATVRTRIKADLKSGLLVQGADKPQPNGAAGRPQRTYILAELAKNVKPAKSPKTPKSEVPATPEAPKADVVVLNVTPVADAPATVDATPVADAEPVTKEIPVATVNPAFA